ncbi:MAG: HAD-IC family P-type ATPase [Oscillospiraceae bacterium]|nr:HAD-IC family P-type ATPase [Oscillospiraceae bacterium]
MRQIIDRGDIVSKVSGFPVHSHKADIPRRNAPPDQGLTSEEARVRYVGGYANLPVEPPSKTSRQIVLGHVLTYFNLIFFILALSVILVGRWWQMGFMVIAVTNTICGIIQEFNAKRVMDKMQFLSSPKGNVIRDGQERVLNTSQLVLDDIVVFRSGNQIYADAIVVEGEVQVSEALITGEADEITKGPGSFLLSGSFVLNGKCHARLERVGADSYVSKLSLEAKRAEKEKDTPMVQSLNRVLLFAGIAILPIGILQVINQTSLHGGNLSEGVVRTVAIVVGMIPDGLFLLATAALAVSVVHLARRRVLVQRMRCIETLARVDVLCVDKTGTITENKMTVKDIVLLTEDRFVEDDIRMIMSDYVGNMSADNDTMTAMHRYFQGTVMQKAEKVLPFSSVRKYGGVSYAEDETYLLGAPEFILGDQYSAHKETIEHYSALGCRVLLLALYDGSLDDAVLAAPIMPLALILLTNKIRKEAAETFAYFEQQGVTIKVISGDNPVTVSHVAREAGIIGAEHYIDATALETPQAIFEAVRNYTVFGRVRPEQKRLFVRALKAQGHTVAMTGDGVNDVLALKDADCSIAMASGSDVACRVSQLVLLNSNFAAMPSVVDEGRRVINNIERSASLFLVRNIFSLFLALITLFAVLPIPINPNQMSLVGGLTIGIPGFILALEPNFKRIQGRFLQNVIFNALPAALTNVILVSGIIIYSTVFNLTAEEMGTMSLVVLSAVGILMVFKVSQPFNLLRRALFIGVVAAMLLSFFIPQLQAVFSISPLGLEAFLILAIFVFTTYPLMWGIRYWLERLAEKWTAFQGRERRKLPWQRGE